MMDVAEKRHRRNQYSRTNRGLVDDADRLGVAGEVAFATRVLGLDRYTPSAKRSTPGYQFTFGPWKIKVYTSTRPGHLFVKEGAVAADIYVLAGVRGPISPENVFWCGWASRRDVVRAAVVQPTMKGTYVLPSHGIARDDLADIGALCQIIGAGGVEARGLIAGYVARRAEADIDARQPGADPQETQGDLFDTPRDRLQS